MTLTAADRASTPANIRSRKFARVFWMPDLRLVRLCGNGAGVRET